MKFAGAPTRYAAVAVAVIAAVGLLLFRHGEMPFVSADVPIAEIVGKPAPVIGLHRPLPAWTLLPTTGHVTGAGSLPPQPPYGASAQVMIRLDESVDMFVFSYRTRLKAAGFTMRSHPVLPNRLLLDPALEALYEADETKGGRTIYIAIRGIGATHFAQLTFWSPPSPRL